MSRKKAKLPRKFGRRKIKQKFRVRQEPWNRQPRRMSDASIDFMDEISPGFAEWYHTNYDSEGRYVGKRI